MAERGLDPMAIAPLSFWVRTPMSKNVARGRSWRKDITTAPSEDRRWQDEALNVDLADTPANDRPLDLSTTAPAARALRDFQRWIRRFRRLGQNQTDRIRHGESPIETIVHDFAESLVSISDPSEVALQLIAAARRLTGATRVELTDMTLAEPREEELIEGMERSNRAGVSDGPRDGSWKIPVGFGLKNWGILQLRETPSDHGRLSGDNPTIRPLKTLCTLAALALEGISTNRLFQALEQDDLDELIPVGGLAPIGFEEETVRDATYMNVVLPYAINQASRHREPVSILSVGIDRLSTIRDMFGIETLNLAMKHVGGIVVKRLRSSDVVSRMEDDRILAMLPHATASNAARIAEEIRTIVEEQCQTMEDLPPLTVSIGAASFPTHARDVLSLLNAADEAMFRAEQSGRNRVVVAGSAVPR